MIDASQMLEKLASLRPLPATAHRLLQVANDPEAGPDAVAKAIGHDVALTANVLRAANSAYYGYVRQVSSVSEATLRLGSDWVKHMALSSILYNSVRHPAAGYCQSADDTWRHSAAVAITCENLCQLLGTRCSGTLYTAALVHDMGKLALDEYVSQEYEQIERKVLEDQLSFVEAERAVLGMDHAEVGALLAERWQFPDDLILAIRWHHEPDRSAAVNVAVDLVHVADALCMMQGIGLGIDALLYRPSAQSVQRLGLTNALFDQAVSRLLDGLERLDAALSGPPVAMAERK